jgi:hypothetical protein
VQTLRYCSHLRTARTSREEPAEEPSIVKVDAVVNRLSGSPLWQHMQQSFGYLTSGQGYQGHVFPVVIGETGSTYTTVSYPSCSTLIAVSKKNRLPTLQAAAAGFSEDRSLCAAWTACAQLLGPKQGSWFAGQGCSRRRPLMLHH